MVDYIIVQAGGKGTRMDYLTNNKPKALVPINNLPMLFHLFRKYPQKKYIIIGDYKYDVLEKYLKTFAEVEYEFINAEGDTGTCAGIYKSLSLIPVDKSFMLIWSDLILPEEFEMPIEVNNYIGVAKDFRCRWSLINKVFVEEPSDTFGVAGLFIFKNKGTLNGIPASGELVRWLKDQTFDLIELPLFHTKEYGLLSEYKKLLSQRCRPFNKLVESEDIIIKEGIDEQGRSLAIRERAWYDKLLKYNYENIPQIYSLDPLTMERIKGKNIYEYSNISIEEKTEILTKIISCLKQVHKLEQVSVDKKSYEEAYITKTLDRLEKIKDLVPFAKNKFITINGRKCRNVFYFENELRDKVNKYIPSEFKLIHGDCTFSNIMMNSKDNMPVLIDPRGYFGTTEFYGDTAYDWVKLYYSIVGNYDQFNLKRFRLEIGPEEVKLQIESNNWENMEETFFELLENEISKNQIKLLHSIIWLSLTTYAWEDYDSICGAFYNGLYYMEEVL